MDDNGNYSSQTEMEEDMMETMFPEGFDPDSDIDSDSGEGESDEA